MVCRFAHVIQSQKKCQVWCVCCAQTSAATAMTLLTAIGRGNSNDKYYTAPWRTDNFVSHLRKQHATMWEDYKKRTNEEKKSFFTTSEAPEAVNLRSFVQPEASIKAQVIAKQKCFFVIDGDIISKKSLICS